MEGLKPGSDEVWVPPAVHLEPAGTQWLVRKAFSGLPSSAAPDAIDRDLDC